jgi:3-oxoacyl-[acyl-carrier protein] reductase
MVEREQAMSEQRFNGQVAVVTGGADGLGRGVAERLAGEGATVALFDRNAELLAATASELSEAGLSVEGHVVDVADADSVETAIGAVVAAHGGLQVMVHCAGIVGPTSTPIADYDVAAFDQVYGVNLRGTFLMVKHALKPMLAAGYGRMLCFASIAGKEGNPGMIGYSSTKAGVIGLVKAVGKEYAESGVTINALAPAVIRTAMVEACTPEQVKYMTDKIPMKRTGTIEEVSAISAFIVSRESSFCTGAVFDISGGRATY